MKTHLAHLRFPVRTLSILCLLLIGGPLLLDAQDNPTLSNISIATDEINKVIVIGYDLADAPDGATISLQASTDAGKLFFNITDELSGDLGDVSNGTGLEIQWSYGSALTESGDYHLRLVADKGPIDIATLVAQVSEQRLRADLESIVGIRHASTGAINLAATQDSLRSCFQQKGLILQEQTWMQGSYEAHNIIGLHHGITEPEKRYIVDAHYDTVNDSPGADDNGTATVGMMEVARVLSQYPTQKGVDFIGFDLEEAGLVGSIRYLTDGRTPGVTIEGVLNLEMIGYYSDQPNTQQFPTGFNLLYPDAYNTVANDDFRGNFITNVGDNQSLDLMTAFENAANQYVPDLKVISISANAGGFYLPDLQRSDHAPFWSQGIPALMLTDGANFRNPNYHSSNDLVNTIDFNFVKQNTQTTLATVATLAGVRAADAEVISFSLSGTVSTTTIPDCQLILSPQPSDHECQIRLSNCPVQWREVSLLSTNGKVVSSQVIQQNQSELRFFTQDLPDGLYLMVFKNQQQQLIRKMMVIH